METDKNTAYEHYLIVLGFLYDHDIEKFDGNHYVLKSLKRLLRIAELGEQPFWHDGELDYKELYEKAAAAGM